MQQANFDQQAKSIRSTTPSAAERESARRLYLVGGEHLTLPEILWKRLSGFYGYPFTRQYGSEPTPEWEMATDGLEPESIKAGLKRVATDEQFRKFPPNPLEFRGLCLPSGEDLGLPGFSDAFRQAVGLMQPKHPAVVHTMLRMGTDQAHKLRFVDKSETAEARFRKHWQATIEHRMAGGDFDKPRLAIEENPSQPKAKLESVEGELSKLMGLFGEAR